MAVRRERLQRLAVRHGEDPDAVVGAILGNVGPAGCAGKGSAITRARWYYDNPERQAEAFKGRRGKMPKKPFDAQGNALPPQDPVHLGLRRPSSQLARAWQATHASVMSKRGNVDADGSSRWLPALVHRGNVDAVG